MSDFWSLDEFLGIAGVQRHMSVKRFWVIRANLHVVDSKPGDSFADKIKPVLDAIFYSTYTLWTLENFQPLARLKVRKFAEVTKFVLGFKCDSSAPQTAGGECFYRLNK